MENIQQLAPPHQEKISQKEVIDFIISSRIRNKQASTIHWKKKIHLAYYWPSTLLIIENKIVKKTQSLLTRYLHSSWDSQYTNKRVKIDYDLWWQVLWRNRTLDKGVKVRGMRDWYLHIMIREGVLIRCT